MTDSSPEREIVTDELRHLIEDNLREGTIAVIRFEKESGDVKLCGIFKSGEIYENVKDSEIKGCEEEDITFSKVIEKYFLTPDRDGYTYTDRMKEGYQMLELIADDIDKAGDGSIHIKDYISRLAREEGILKQEPKQRLTQYTSGKSR